MLTLKALAEQVGATLVGDPELLVDAILPLEFAGPQHLSFFANAKYLEAARSTRAGALIACEPFTGSPKNLLLHPDPYLAAAKIAQLFHPPLRKTPGIHPSAVIAASAKLGEKVYIGPHVVIEEGAQIANHSQIFAQCFVGENARVGPECILYPAVKVMAGCQIGARCILQPGVVVGGEGFGFAEDKQATAGHRRVKIPQLGNVVVGDDVEIGANSTVDRATFGTTFIGNGCKIDNLVMIAHNVRMQNDCVIVAQAGISGSTTLGERVIIGGQAGLVGHIKIGNDVKINAQSGVNQSIQKGKAVGGSPAIPLQEFFKQQGALRSIDEMRRRIFGIKEKT